MSVKSDKKKVITETILLYKQKVNQTVEVILAIQKLQQKLDSIND
jgi:hypothetical protein